MSIKFYDKLAPYRKLITVKYPMQDDNSDWEYAIVDKQHQNQVLEHIKNGKIKDMKTILFNTKQLILKGDSNEQ